MQVLCLLLFRVPKLPCSLMQKLKYIWLGLVVSKEQCKERLSSHRNKRPVSFEGKTHSIYLALFPKCHGEVSQSEIHFVRTDKSCHHFLACVLVHNKADFQSWECFGARIFILSSSSNLYINKWKPLCLCCLAWSTKLLCWPTMLTSSALMT